MKYLIVLYRFAFTPALELLTKLSQRILNIPVETNSQKGTIGRFTRMRTSFVMSNSNSVKRTDFANYDWAVAINRQWLNMIGLWPRNTFGLRRLLENLHVMAIVLAIFGFLAIPSYRLLLKQQEYISIIDNFGLPIAFTSIILKICVLHAKRNVLLPVINMMAKDWAKPKTDKEWDVMFRYARIARVVSIFSFTSGVISITLMIVLPKFGIRIRHTTNGLDVFPVPAYHVHEVPRTPYFEITYVAQIIMLWVMLMCYSGIDMFFGMIILHICGQVENLRVRIENEKKFTNFKRSLAMIITDHIRLSRTVDTIESTFTPVLFAVMLFFCVITCMYLTGIISMFAERDTLSLTRLCYMVFTLCGSCMHMSLYFLAGQALVNKSEAIHNAAYECGWINLKSNEVKSLILVMAKSKKPLFVTAGKLFPMTMLTFANITKICFSYLSFLVTRL